MYQQQNPISQVQSGIHGLQVLRAHGSYLKSNAILYNKRQMDNASGSASTAAKPTLYNI